MPDDNGDATQARNPDSQSLHPTSLQPNLEQRIMALEAENRVFKKDNQPSLKAKVGEALLIFINALLLIATVVIAYIYYGQLGEMRKATKATQDAVSVASQTLTETQASNARQAVLTEKSRVSSEIAANKALQASVDNFREDQRAWLGASDYTYAIPESGPISSTVNVLNTGKSPAVDIICRITGTTRMKSYVLRESDIVYPPELVTVEEGTIFPNQHFPLIAGHKVPMQPDKQKAWFENVQDGEWTQYFYGDVRYKDIYGRDHWTHFCTQFVPATKSGTPCPIYNSTDDEKSQKKLR